MAVDVGRHARDLAARSALKGPLQERLSFLVEVPSLEVIYDGQVVGELSTFGLDLVSACVVECVY